VNDVLRKYVEEQARNHVDPKYIRYNLLKAGWNAIQVDETIAKVFTHPGRPTSSGSKPLLLYLVVVIAILVGVIIFIYTRYQDELFTSPDLPEPTPIKPTPQPVEPIKPVEPVIPAKPVAQTGEVREQEPPKPTQVNWSLENPCEEIDRSVDKDACYTKLIKDDDFDCDNLTDAIERNFCFRALDAYMFPIDWDKT